MVIDPDATARLREELSALADGQLDGPGVADATARWHRDADASATWHAYQLIGDVLRSDDLASAPGHDAEFLATLRRRLADEPVVLAPQRAAPAPAAGPVQLADGPGAGSGRVALGANVRRSWRMPAAVAAGVMALGGVFTLLRGPVSPFAAWESGLAAGASSPALEPSLLGPGEPRALVANGQLIRDARLDRYLEAHQQFAGSSALGVPSGFLRSATVVSGVER